MARLTDEQVRYLAKSTAVDTVHDLLDTIYYERGQRLKTQHDDLLNHARLTPGCVICRAPLTPDQWTEAGRKDVLGRSKNETKRAI